MRHILRAGTELKHGKKLREGIDGQPEPEHLGGAAQPAAQLVQLEVRQVELAEEALMEGSRMLASTGQPSGDGGLSKTEHTLCSRGIQPFGQSRKHLGDLVRGGFQTVQGRIASNTEGGAAR